VQGHRGRRWRTSYGIDQGVPEILGYLPVKIGGYLSLLAAKVDLDFAMFLSAFFGIALPVTGGEL
jgi:hypothetical protein